MKQDQSILRVGQVIGIKPECISEYRRLHAETWPEIRSLLSQCNIRNYSIFLKEPENLLFAYMEYTGSSWKEDMKKMAEDTAMKRWWLLTDPMQVPLETRGPNEWWAGMDMVFFNG